LTTYKDGYIIQEPEDLRRYMMIYFGFILFFAMVYFNYKMIFDYCIQAKRYQAKTDSEKAFYISLWGANTHHICVGSFALYNFYYPSQDCTNQQHWAWFFDHQCLLQVDQRFVYLSLISSAYLSFDFYWQFFHVGGSDTLSY
jgi:hypothetical protein